MTAAELNSGYDSCLVCGGNAWSTIRDGSDLCRTDYKMRFKLTHCSSCGHIMQNPMPDDLELNAAYSVSSGYAAYRAAWKQSGWPLWKILRTWTMHRRISLLKRYGSGSEMLEVGCGAGDFLMAAYHEGWNARAVEYNRNMVDLIVKELGFDVRAGELNLNLWDEGTIDLVAFWNVLEHLQNPLRELSMANQYLRTGGRVFMNIPTRQAAEHGQWFGQYWALLDLPRHLHFFDEATLSRICDKTGFDLVVYRTPFVESAWCYYMSSWNWANQDGKKKFRWLWFTTLSVIVTLGIPYIFVEAMRKHGTEAFAVAVKQ